MTFFLFFKSIPSFLLLTRAKELNKYIEPPAPNSVLTPILKSGEPPDSHLVKGFSGKVNFEDNSLPEVLLLRGGTALLLRFCLWARVTQQGRERAVLRLHASELAFSLTEGAPFTGFCT